MDPNVIPVQFQPFIAAPIVLGVVGAIKATKRISDDYMPLLCLAIGVVLGVSVGLDLKGDLVFYGLSGLVSGLAAESLFGGTGRAAVDAAKGGP